jgi:hypothetical protein
MYDQPTHTGSDPSYRTTATSSTAVGELGPSNEKSEYTLEEMGRFYVGRVRRHQRQRTQRQATSESFSRRRELRRQLVRNKL